MEDLIVTRTSVSVDHLVTQTERTNDEVPAYRRTFVSKWFNKKALKPFYFLALIKKNFFKQKQSVWMHLFSSNSYFFFLQSNIWSVNIFFFFWVE